jgi:hypothetical protein
MPARDSHKLVSASPILAHKLLKQAGARAHFAQTPIEWRAKKVRRKAINGKHYKS